MVTPSNFANTEIKAMRSSLRASWLALYTALDMLDLAPLDLHISILSKAQAILAETRILKSLGYKQTTHLIAECKQLIFPLYQKIAP